MYDFYKNPPKSKEEVREWLHSWLQPIDTVEPPLVIGEDSFQEVYAFTRAFHIHSVFKHIYTGEYAWWVISRDTPVDTSTFPKQRFKTYQDLLNGVAEQYAIAWKLPPAPNQMSPPG